MELLVEAASKSTSGTWNWVRIQANRLTCQLVSASLKKEASHCAKATLWTRVPQQRWWSSAASRVGPDKTAKENELSLEKYSVKENSCSEFVCGLNNQRAGVRWRRWLPNSTPI